MKDDLCLKRRKGVERQIMIDLQARGGIEAAYRQVPEISLVEGAFSFRPRSDHGPNVSDQADTKEGIKQDCNVGYESQ